MKMTAIAASAGFLGLLAAAPLPAAMEMGGSTRMNAGTGMPAAAAPAGGALVRESAVSGHGLSYRLYTWEERAALMKGMTGMAMAGVNEEGTHHLMVLITGPDGRPVSGAKVGFLVTGPDGERQTTLTMGMYEGYGADLALAAKGAYRVKLKADLGGTVIGEDFVLDVD